MIQKLITHQKSKSKIGIVLSGGGVKTGAHIGLLQALKEEEIEIDLISGTSGGALVGAIYAAGYSPKEILEFCKNAPSWFNIQLFGGAKTGIVNSRQYISYFKKFLPKNAFQHLSKKLFITATNLEKGQAEVFSKGEVILPMIASSAIPMWFTPVEIEGNLYADGGVMDNFPIEPLLPITDKIIGSYLGSKNENSFNPNSKKAMLNRTLALARLAIEKHKFQYCDYLFQPTEIRNISTLNAREFDAAFEVGYKSAKEEMPNILSSLGMNSQNLKEKVNNSCKHKQQLMAA